MELKNKSNENLVAANLLIQNGKYASSVHCAYYSCLQLIKHIINKYVGKSYKMQDGEAFHHRKSSHGYLLNEIVKNLNQKNGVNFANTVRRAFFELKDDRLKADYQNISINKIEAEASYLISNQVQNILKSVYKIP